MQVSWWVELAVRPGCLDGFETLTGEMIASARAESGVFAYQRFISAVFGDRYASLVERKRFIVFGEPSEALRTLLDAYGASYHPPFGPFRYWG